MLKYTYLAIEVAALVSTNNNYQQLLLLKYKIVSIMVQSVRIMDNYFESLDFLFLRNLSSQSLIAFCVYFQAELNLEQRESPLIDVFRLIKSSQNKCIIDDLV